MVEEYLLRYRLERAIDSVTTYFDEPFKDTLRVFIFEDGRPRAWDRRIYLSRYSSRSTEIIIHEVTHAVLRPQGSSFAMEGQAMFSEYQFTSKRVRLPALFQFGYGGNGDTLMPLKYFIDNDTSYWANDKVEALGYSEAGSFYQFLDERFGREKARELYRRGLNEIEPTYGMSLDSLEGEWRRWLFGDASRDTVKVL